MRIEVLKLKKKRTNLCLSRAQISRLLRIPENSLFRWEAGICQPSVYYLAQIRTLLGVIEEIENER